MSARDEIIVRIGTRGSDLALWQARFVAARLESAGCTVEIVVLETRGDRIDDVPLHQIEGKAFFTAEIESALHAGRVDVAVHSHKDLPVEEPPGLTIVAVPGRADPGERLLITADAYDEAAAFLPLRRGARVGTSAPRRTEQLQVLRPDLCVQPLRGNVPTRVRRLREGRHDAIILAAAGLDRLQLDLADLVIHDLSTALLVPAPAQGALAIQTRADDDALIELCRAALHDQDVARCVAAERRLLLDTGGGCNLPLGCSVARMAEETDGAGAWRAQAFLGAGHPRPDAPARWAAAEGTSPDEAVRHVLAVLATDAPTGTGPLAGRRYAIVGAADGGTRVGARLEALGAVVLHERVLAFEPLAALPAAQVAGLSQGDGLAVTSGEAARRLAGTVVPSGVLVGAVGNTTAAELTRVGIAVDLVGTGGARELAHAMPIEAGRRVLFPCAEDALPELEESFDLCGVRVERVALYRTVARADVEHERGVDARILMSPSALEACLEFERALGPDGPARVALGRATAAACARQGLAVSLLEDLRA